MGSLNLKPGTYKVQAAPNLGYDKKRSDKRPNLPYELITRKDDIMITSVTKWNVFDTNLNKTMKCWFQIQQ